MTCFMTSLPPAPRAESNALAPEADGVHEYTQQAREQSHTRYTHNPEQREPPEPGEPAACR